MDQENIIQEMTNQLKEYGFAIEKRNYSYNELQAALSYHINYLITNDFAMLVQLLYRLDINEQEVSKSLKETNSNLASNSIADLIINHQQKKLQLRKMFNKDTDIPDDERW